MQRENQFTFCMVSFKIYYFQNSNVLAASDYLPKLKRGLRLLFTADVTISIQLDLFQQLFECPLANFEQLLKKPLQ